MNPVQLKIVTDARPPTVRDTSTNKRTVNGTPLTYRSVNGSLSFFETDDSIVIHTRRDIFLTNSSAPCDQLEKGTQLLGDLYIALMNLNEIASSGADATIDYSKYLTTPVALPTTRGLAIVPDRNNYSASLLKSLNSADEGEARSALESVNATLIPKNYKPIFVLNSDGVGNSLPVAVFGEVINPEDCSSPGNFSDIFMPIPNLTLSTTGDSIQCLGVADDCQGSFGFFYSTPERYSSCPQVLIEGIGTDDMTEEFTVHPPASRQYAGPVFGAAFPMVNSVDNTDDTKPASNQPTENPRSDNPAEPGELNVLGNGGLSDNGMGSTGGPNLTAFGGADPPGGPDGDITVGGSSKAPIKLIEKYHLFARGLNGQISEGGETIEMKDGAFSFTFKHKPILGERTCNLKVRLLIKPEDSELVPQVRDGDPEENNSKTQFEIGTHEGKVLAQVLYDSDNDPFTGIGEDYDNLHEVIREDVSCKLESLVHNAGCQDSFNNIGKVRIICNAPKIQREILRQLFISASIPNGTTKSSTSSEGTVPESVLAKRFTYGLLRNKHSLTEPKEIAIEETFHTEGLRLSFGEDPILHHAVRDYGPEGYRHVIVVVPSDDFGKDFTLVEDDYAAINDYLRTHHDIQPTTNAPGKLFSNIGIMTVRNALTGVEMFKTHGKTCEALQGAHRVRNTSTSQKVDIVKDIAETRLSLFETIHEIHEARKAIYTIGIELGDDSIKNAPTRDILPFKRGGNDYITDEDLERGNEFICSIRNSGHPKSDLYASVLVHHAAKIIGLIDDLGEHYIDLDKNRSAIVNDKLIISTASDSKVGEQDRSRYALEEIFNWILYLRLYTRAQSYTMLEQNAPRTTAMSERKWGELIYYLIPPDEFTERIFSNLYRTANSKVSSVDDVNQAIEQIDPSESFRGREGFNDRDMNLRGFIDNDSFPKSIQVGDDVYYLNVRTLAEVLRKHPCYSDLHRRGLLLDPAEYKKAHDKHYAEVEEPKRLWNPDPSKSSEMLLWLNQFNDERTYPETNACNLKVNITGENDSLHRFSIKYGLIREPD